jgi:hypothetical protein
VAKKHSHTAMCAYQLCRNMRIIAKVDFEAFRSGQNAEISTSFNIGNASHAMALFGWTVVFEFLLANERLNKIRGGKFLLFRRGE